MSTYPIISLVGRPNVGKSTIFNKLVGGYWKSLTYDRPGVTRDRQYRVMKLGEHLEGAAVVLVDTGGFLPDLPKHKLGPDGKTHDQLNSRRHKISEDSDQFFRLMQDQAQIAIEESHLVFLVVDGREGLNPYEESIVKVLRQKKKEFWLIINKCDSLKIEESADFYKLAVKEKDTLPISAEHAHGLLALRERLEEWWQNWSDDQAKKSLELIENGENKNLQDWIKSPYPVIGKVAIIGNPNVGKSTLLNQLIESNRSLVSEVAGTTTDPVESFWHMDFSKEKDMPEILAQGPVSLTLVDTAGIRRSAAKKDVIEEQSIYRSLRCISESDIVFLMTDVDRGISQQDKRLVALALDRGKSVIVVVNKVDMLSKEKKESLDEWVDMVKKQNPWMSYCAVVCISAQKKWGIDKLKLILRNTLVVLHKKLGTGELNRAIAALIEKNPFRVDKANYLKVKYASLVKSSPPTILLFANRELEISPQYRRYLTKGIRDHFSLYNTPIHLIFRRGESREQQKLQKLKDGPISMEELNP
ncbi:MAG: ribosome biogenesis GTPase Der [Bacteriovoracaceae bacterium]|nr:ribosome biogenesis GTPase Der [Bacteriovoracaceae bacterium]